MRTCIIATSCQAFLGPSGWFLQLCTFKKTVYVEFNEHVCLDSTWIRGWRSGFPSSGTQSEHSLNPNGAYLCKECNLYAFRACFYFVAFTGNTWRYGSLSYASHWHVQTARVRSLLQKSSVTSVARQNHAMQSARICDLCTYCRIFVTLILPRFSCYSLAT